MAASNIGTGLGIALGGRAKDFTQIELAQRRQAAMEEKAKAAAKDKKLEDITKDISIKPGEYFQFREKEVERMLGEYIEGQMSGSMDYGEAQKARWNLLTNLEKYKQEKKRADEFRKQALKGEAATDDDINILYTASTPEEVASSIKRGGIITAPDGAYTINGYKVINIPKRQMEIARNVKTEYDIANSQTTPDGKRVYIGEPKLEDYKAMLGADFDQDPDVVRNVISRHRDEFEQRGLEGDALIAAAREKYINIGSNFLSGRAFKSMGGDNNITIINQGEQPIDYNMQSVPVAEVQTIVKTPRGEDQLATFAVRGAQTLGDEKATLPANTRAFYIDSGEPVTEADIKQGTYNQFGVGYLLTKDITLNTPNGKVEYRKGMPIPQQYERLAVERGAAEPRKVVFVKAGDRSFTVPAELYFQTRLNSETNKELKATLNAQFNKLEQDFQSELRNFNRIKGGKKTTTTTPSTQKPVSSQGGGKTEPKKDRVSGNPALQELMKQNKK